MLNIFRIKGFLPYILIVFLNAFIDLGHKIVIQNTVFKIYDGPQQVIMTAIVNALLLIPFIALFTPSGYLADKYPKNKIVKVTMFISIIATLLITLSYYMGWFWVSFGLTLFLAAQAAFFSPAKYGYIRELSGKENIAIANAYVQAVTIISMLSGVFVYSILFEKFITVISGPLRVEAVMQAIAPIGFILVLLSIIQTFLSFYLPEIKKTDPNMRFTFRKYISAGYLKRTIRVVNKTEVIWLSIIGLTIFWSLNQVIFATFGSYLKEIAGITNTIIAQGIMAIGGIGVIIGAMYAGKISRNYIEIGIIPIGTIGMAFCLFLLPKISNPYILAGLFLLYGIFGGMLIVPLESLVQFNSRDSDSGKVMAAKNFIENIGMMIFLVGTMIFAYYGFSSVTLFNIMCFIAVLGTFYTLYKIPQSLIRYIIRFVFSSRYNLQVLGLNNIPSSGGLLLLGNHTSWIDWAILQMAVPRPLRFVMARQIYEKWYLKWFLDFVGVVPISSSGSKDAIKTVKELLNDGQAVVIFPEGHISRNGQISIFHGGFELSVKETDAVILPFYLRGLWGSIYSHASNKYRDSSRITSSRTITVCFGEPMPATSSAAEVKSAVSTLSIYTWQEYTNIMEPVHLQWLRTSKKLWSELCIADYDGKTFSHHKLITAVLLFTRKFKHLLMDQQNIGILLPTSSAGIISNLAVLMLGKTIVNLNYTSSPAILEKCLQKGDIKTVITSKLFLAKLEKKGFNMSEALQKTNVIYMEDCVNFSKLSIAWILGSVKLLPASLLIKMFSKASKLDDVAAILFSSGSEGTPKGVMLTHRNIIGNIKQIVSVVSPDQTDIVMNSLPLFHAFGLTVATFMPLSEGLTMVCHPDPTDGANIGKLAAVHKTTILFGTSTFLRLYIKNKKLNSLMFKSVRLVVAGAEKLSEEVKAAFKAKFGLDIYEGYGTTETTPVASVNIPDVLMTDDWVIQVGTKGGTVGLPLPGSTFKIVDPVTLAELKINEEGLILIGGTQIMAGYLNDQDKTNEVIVEKDGIRWYKTGDKGRLDEDGFLVIVDRYSRFAKLGGEMISLGAVETEIKKIISNEEIEVLAVAVPEEKKGEQIILLISGQITGDEIKRMLLDAQINPIMIPSIFLPVEMIPKLGSGKTDFAASKQIAINALAENIYSFNTK